MLHASRLHHSGTYPGTAVGHPPPPSSAPPAYSYQQYAPPPPAGADPSLWRWFSSVDADKSGAISPTELQSALVNGNMSHFDMDTIKMLMTTFDVDKSGTIDFQEFAGLWKYIADWQNVFRSFDRDCSGTIEGNELAQAMRSFGYSLSPRLLELITIKYSSVPTSGRGPPPGITFDRFVRACVSVKMLTEAFQKEDTDHDGWVSIDYEKFMALFFSLP